LGSSSTFDADESRAADPGGAAVARLGLVLLWSVDEPRRSGEVALVPPISRHAELLLGRGGSGALDQGRLLGWVRQRPGANEPTGLLASPRISRVQLRLRQPTPDTLELHNVGRCPLLQHGASVERAVLRVGDTVELGRVAALMLVSRPAVLPMPTAADAWPGAMHAFGHPDRCGLVGESPVAWDLRARIGFTAGRTAHVLVRGPSGTGKELVAQAVHALSARGTRPIVARNAATFPETLVDAELFGNAKGFPNVGTPERPGLVGEADGTTLFLDEFGELPSAVQAHLLRVLDAGEYSRLGDARQRRADLRLIAATNRPPTALKEDVLARLHLRIEVPGLPERREDVPLIVAHLLRQIARRDPAAAQRYFPEGDPEGWPRMTPRLAVALACWPYTTHVRELAALLWRVLAAPPHPDRLDLSAELAPPGASSPGGPAAEAEREADRDPDAMDPMSIPSEKIQALLDLHEGRQEPVWRELGLSSRHVLTRLVRRYGLKVRGRSGSEET
jgi:two-component system nitrogen regulation response regulator GlnG/two-component system response regulator HydG